MPDGGAPRGGDRRLHISNTTIRETGPGGRQTEPSVITSHRLFDSKHEGVTAGR